MTTFISIIFVIISLVMVLSILLQAGKGGGLGSALGGGASQSVFGGGGGADFMAKLTQGFAAAFMITAMYLAYASAHAGSEFLEEEDEGSEGLFASDRPIDFERIGPNALKLPTVEEGRRMQAEASTLVPAFTAAPDAIEAAPPTPDPVAEPATDPVAVEGSLEDGADADDADDADADAADDPGADARPVPLIDASPAPAADDAD